MRWILWHIGFWGAITAIAATAYFIQNDRGYGLVLLAQAAMFAGVFLLIAANPHRYPNRWLR